MKCKGGKWIPQDAVRSGMPTFALGVFAVWGDGVVAYRERGIQGIVREAVDAGIL